jgi:hypothetical protein
MNDSITVKQAWEVPAVTALGDLATLTAAGAAGNEDGSGFTS